MHKLTTRDKRRLKRAVKIVVAARGQRGAARLVGCEQARLSHIVHGAWRQVRVTTDDLSRFEIAVQLVVMDAPRLQRQAAALEKLRRDVERLNETLRRIRRIK